MGRGPSRKQLLYSRVIKESRMTKQPLDCKSSLGRELQPPCSLPGRSQTSMSPVDQTYLGVRGQREPLVQFSGQSAAEPSFGIQQGCAGTERKQIVASAKKEISQIGEEHVKAQLHREMVREAFSNGLAREEGEKRMVTDSMRKGPGQESPCLVPELKESRMVRDRWKRWLCLKL